MVIVCLPVRYSYLQILPDGNVGLSVVFIFLLVFIFFPKRFFLKREEFSDARIVSITKKIYFLQYNFYKDS